MRQMKLAITWGHEKVAKELIFEKKDYKFKVCFSSHFLDLRRFPKIYGALFHFQNNQSS